MTASRELLAVENERLRLGLLACARESGADVSDGIPDFPDIVDWAVDCVRALRTDYDDVLEENR